MLENLCPLIPHFPISRSVLFVCFIEKNMLGANLCPHVAHFPIHRASFIGLFH